MTRNKNLRSKEKESRLLAAAIVELLDWQSRQLQLKEERKIKAMLTRQRNLRQKSRSE